MRARRWVLFIGLNIIVSVLATLGVLSLRGEVKQIVVVTATAGAISGSTAPTSGPVDLPTQPTANPTTPTSVEYRVQGGDTLGGIALAYDIPLADLLLANNLTEKDIIKPGQVLVVPFGVVVTSTPVTPSPPPVTPTPSTPTPFPTETPTPPGPVQVRIQEVLAPGDLGREGVVIVNRGRTVNLDGWTLGTPGRDEVYVFPRLTLAEGIPVTVYTIAGDDTPKALHWGQGAGQWGESGTVVELRDAEDDLIATFTVP